MNIEELAITSNELSIIKRSLLLSIEQLNEKIEENETNIKNAEYASVIRGFHLSNKLFMEEISQISKLLEKLEVTHE